MPDLNEHLPFIADLIGPVGVFIFLLFIAAAWFITRSGWKGFGNDTRVIGVTRLDRFETKLDAVESRLGHVEQDLENRPTQRDIHDLREAIGRMDERQKSVERIGRETNTVVNRIQEFLLELAKGSRK